VCGLQRTRRVSCFWWSSLREVLSLKAAVCRVPRCRQPSRTTSALSVARSSRRTPRYPFICPTGTDWRPCWRLSASYSALPSCCSSHFTVLVSFCFTVLPSQCNAPSVTCCWTERAVTFIVSLSVELCGVFNSTCNPLSSSSNFVGSNSMCCEAR